MLPPFDWTTLPRQPIFQGLLLSVALHLAAILLLQPAPGAGTPRTMVINARMELSPPAPSPTETHIREETPPVTQYERARPVAPLPILAAKTPAPAPPVPSPPAQVISAVARNKTPTSQPDASAASTPLKPAPTQGNPGGIANSSILPALPIAIDTTWYLARQVDVHPKAIGSVQPAYPEEARRRGLEGTLKLMLKIDDLGRVQSAEVVEATPPGVFDEAALEAFRRARFQPAMRDGRPVRYEAYLRVEFKLRD